MINLKTTCLLGHRGARSEAPENTLFGFQHAHSLQARGLAGIEFDVQLTADGHLVVFHDDTLLRLCGLQSRIDQLSLTEIQRHLQDGHQIITLDALSHALPLSLKEIAASKLSAAQLLSELQKRARNSLYGLPNIAPFLSVTSSVESQAHALTRFTHIELEVKTHNRTNYRQLIKALANYLVDSPLASLPIVITSFDTYLHAKIQRHKSLNKLRRGLLVRTQQSLDTAPNTALQLGCSQLGIYYPLLTRAVIQNCHRYGLPVSAWTVNDIEQVRQLVDWQVDFIISDIPTQLL
ncbi:glycerophosphodiester phosphodiesterase [Psychrobacter sp. 16-MNA-CIBAN-0192]|uniref:glycerophosphodiester phosphodiesterase n=1 Tax=Psychrobacter sp. 16-MNA-CIBAN-0192 TaxID=3140448 RepID=UPI00332B14F7